MKPDVKKFLKQFTTTGFKKGDLVLKSGGGTMKYITYDEFTITLKAKSNLSKKEQREVRRILCLGDIVSYVEDTLVPEHLQKKVKVEVV